MFANGGDMGRRIRELDWATTSLGPPTAWPATLHNAVSLMLPAGTEIVLFWGPDYVALYNDAYAPTIGDKHPRALGRPARESWTELWDDLEPLLAHVRSTGETYSARDRPFYIERAGYGEEVYFDISYSPVLLDDGSVGGVLCIVSETTDRVRATRAIAADRQRLGEMFDSAPSFMAVLRVPGFVFELANTAYCRLVGNRDLIGRTLPEAIPEVARQGFADLLYQVAETRQPHHGRNVPILLPNAAGAIEERRLDFIYQPMIDAAGTMTGIFIEGIDLTERHRAETALVLSSESLALATEAAEIGTWDLDLVADTLTWPPRTRAMFGLPADCPVSMADFYAGLHPDDLEATTASFAAAIDPARREMYDVEYRTIGRDDGVVRWVSAKGRGIFDGDICVRALGTTIDITRRKLIEDELRESEERFRQVADSAPALIWITDAHGRLEFANNWFERLLGITADEIRQHGWARVIPPKDRERVYNARNGARGQAAGFAGELRVVGADGSIRWIHAEARPRFLNGVFAGHVGCAVDVTDAHLAGEKLEARIAERTAELRLQIAERERVEATLHQMQRLEAVGQLTSGVAHDFNNLLTVVLGNVDIIARAVDRGTIDARMRTRLEHVRTAAERGATLTAQLLAFSRRQRLETKVVDLNEAVNGMTELLRSTLGRAIAIETQLESDLWPALVDPTQIELIILNLAINARDAMPGGGTLIVSTCNVTRVAPERPEEPPAGDYVAVAVSDTGSGMDQATLARAFEPFFTTKDVGKGSGLGLAQVFGFAKQSGGGVRIDTSPGAGTVVSVFLPRAAGDAACMAASPIPAESVTLEGRTVLVLDDEDAVREITAATLRDMGCHVIQASDGSAALRALARERGIEAVVADIAMPGMNGVEFARLAKQDWPALPVMFVTGYADLEAIADVPADRIIRKPYSRDDLAARVRALLAERAASE